jgi:hypothetical protein
VDYVGSSPTFGASRNSSTVEHQRYKSRLFPDENKSNRHKPNNTVAKVSVSSILGLESEKKALTDCSL